MSIELNTKVTCPVTDSEGEVSYVIGTLVDLNSRYATVETSDGKKIKVGKTKIEPLVGNAKKIKIDKKEWFCPECNKSSNDCHSNDDAMVDGLEPFKTNQFWCNDCDVEFGPELKKAKIDRTDRNYVQCKSASGKSSRDNGDSTAIELRGKELSEVYLIASKYLNTPISDLQAKYAHLNPGQQRMCLGNRIRGSK